MIEVTKQTMGNKVFHNGVSIVHGVNKVEDAKWNEIKHHMRRAIRKGDIVVKSIEDKTEAKKKK